MSNQFQQFARRMRRSPVFAAMTLLTLATGIGATTAIFSVVNAVLIKPLPFPGAASLVGVWHTAPGIGLDMLNMAPSYYYAYREENRSFEDIGVWSSGSVSITGTAEPEQVDNLWVTDGLLPVLGIQPARGRWFTAKDDAPKSPDTMMLSHSFWQTRFGGDPNIIGRRVLVNGVAREVIGVMPEHFRFLNRRFATILPMQFNRAELFIGNFSYQAVARLKPGVTIAQANSDVARMMPMLPEKFPVAPGMSFKMLEEARLGPRVQPLKDEVIGDTGRVLWVLMATVGIVLFIACANVANLLLVRAEGRQQELAVRTALGASRGRIAWELLFETVTLGLIGGVLGLGVAYGALRLIVRLAPSNLPRLDEISIDPAVLAFTSVVSVFAGLLFGLVPVLKYGGPRVGNSIRTGSRTFTDGRERHWTRSTLVVVQVALAMVLLTGSGLMIRTLHGLSKVQPGFTGPEQLLTFRVSVANADVKEPERVARMYNDFVDRLAAIPGVTSVSLTNGVPMDGTSNNDPIFVEDRPGPNDRLPPLRKYKHLSPGYFQTMGNPLVAGRDFTWTDVHEMRPVVIVSEALAREYWGSPAAALGKRVRENNKGTWREIVGVAQAERDNGVHQKAPVIVYWPLLKTNFWTTPVDVRRTLAVVVRSSRTGTQSFLNDVRQAIWSVNPNVPLANVRTVRTIFDRSLARTSFTFVMLTIAAGMALLLGIVGIYGVIAYSISQRTREIGIRIALGAPFRNVRGMFVRHGLTLAAIGVACGIAAAVPLTRLMRALLFEVSPVDPATYAAVCVVLVLAAALAAYLPARRATRVDPVEALRAE
jgi:putative ABC transport system permease protein